MARSQSKFSSMVGSGRAGRIRRRVQAPRPAQGVSKQAIRRLARRAGVKRMSEGIYTEAPVALRAWLKTIVKDAVVYAEHAKRFTLTVNDVILALKRNGSTLYGFTYYEKRERLTRKLPASALAARTVTGRAASTAKKTAKKTAKTPARAASTAGAAGAARRGDRLGATDLVRAGAAEETPKVVSRSNAKVQMKMTGGGRPRKGSRLGSNHGSSSASKKISPRTPKDLPEAGARVTPERAQDIQKSLSTFRDTVIERQKDSSTTPERMQDWVAAHMLGRGMAPCSASELDIVIGALVDRDAVFKADGKIFFV